ncbi:MAG: TIGR00730 family Rossman fold protein [Myxococcota bacterium]
MSEGPAAPEPERFAVTVYAGSRRRARAEHLALAAELGRAVAARGWLLVYGGSNVGLMGACADAALAAGGRVEGVILDSFSRVAHRGLHALDVVDDMRARRAGLARRGDAFVALPGGFGTLEEISEILVERQLGFHRKPLVLMNPDGFWDPLLVQFARMHDAGLLAPEHQAVPGVVEDVAGVLAAIDAPPAAGHASAPVDKW